MADQVATPRHLWVIGIIALLWNAIGAMDYVMTQLRVDSYMSQFTPEQLEFFYNIPAPIVAAWAIAVWGGVLGVILLLLRNRMATWVLLVSLLSMVITAIHNYGISNGLEVIGDPFSLAFTALIFAVALCLFLYARKMQAVGVLS